MMAEHTEAEEEERAWARAQARAFLAPPAEARDERREAMRHGEERQPPSRAVLVLAVVPLPVPGREARGDETMRRRGEDERQEDEGDG